MSVRPIRSRLLPVAAGALVALLALGPARGATYTITTLAEDTDVNGNCTLREALLAASTDSTNDLCVGDTDPDTIVLEAVGTYELDDGTVSSAARQLTVRGATPQRDSYVVDLGDVQRFLVVDFDSELTLENLTLTHGDGGAHGGVLLAEDSDLTLRNVAIATSDADNGGALSFRTSSEHRLDIEASTFSGNTALGDQAFGGAVEVDLQGAGSVRIVEASFLDNRIDSATGTFARRGGGLSIQSFDGGAIELRHLELRGNQIDAPSFAIGAGASVHVNSTAPFVLEDAVFADNEHLVATGTNGPSGLDLALHGPAASVRRLRLLGNLSGLGEDQAVIQVSIGATVVSDLLIVDGDAAGLFLSTSGQTCSLVAGNLTVAGNAQSGLRMSEGDCPLRIENSIFFGNATSDGENLQIFSGTPEISAENLVDVDPLFVAAGSGDYRLAAGSVAEDAGEASFDSVGPFDAAHGPRLDGEGLDLGALERHALFADDFEWSDLLAWSRAAP